MGLLNTSAKWKSLIQTSAQMSVVARMYYGDETDGVDFVALTNNSNIIIDGKPYLALINNIPNIKSTIKVTGSVKNLFGHSISGDRLAIDNLSYDPRTENAPGKRFSDTMDDITSGAASDIGFYNRRIEIRLWLEGMTTWTDGLAVMKKGRIKDISHTRKQTVIPFEDGSDISYLDAGDLVAESDAADSVQGLPPETIGLVRPEISGDHIHRLGDTDETLVVITRPNRTIPMLDLGLDADGNRHWLLSNRTLDEIDDIWGFDGVAGRHVRIADYTLVQNTALGAIIKHAQGVYFYDYLSPVSVSGEANVGGGDWSPEARMFDGSFALNCDSAAEESGDQSFIKLDFLAWENFGLPDASIIEITIWGRTSYQETESPTVNFQIETTQVKANGLTATIYELHIDPDSTQGDIAEPVTVNHHIVDDDGGISEASVYEIYKRIEYLPDGNLDLSASVKGSEYGDWVNDREAAVDTDPRTGEDYDFTHDDHDGSGDLIENFAGYVEDVLRTLMTQGDSDVDMGAFNETSTIIPAATWKCASQITKRTALKKFLADVGRSCKSWIWMQPDGYFKMSALEDTYAASDRVIDARKAKKLKFSRTKLTDLKTAVNVLYDYSEGGAAGFSSSTGVSEDTDCQLFYNITELQSTLDFETKHVHSSATAVLINTFWLHWLKNLHNIASGELPRIHLDLDIGSIIELSHMQFKVYGEDITANTTRAGQTIYKYWKIYQVDRGDTFKFKAIQMHRLIAEV